MMIKRGREEERQREKEGEEGEEGKGDRRRVIV